MTNSNWVYSGAPIGDTSTYVYNSTSVSGQTLTLNTGVGDELLINNISSLAKGVHIYKVNTLPNSTTNLSSPSTGNYYGVFFTDISGTFDLNYDFSDYPCSPCSNIFSRNDNSVLSWNNVNGTLTNCNIGVINQSTVGYNYRAEFIIDHNSVNSTINVTSCNNYVSPSGNYTWVTSGVYTDTLVAHYDCDSVITINLTIDNFTYTTINEIHCNSYVSPSGNYTWYNSGVYVDTLSGANGCDSIININLTIGTNSSSSNINEISCGDYISPSGNYTWTNSGTYIDTIQNVTGCDSIITINLIIGNNTSSTIIESVCNSYTSPNGSVYYSSGVYYNTILNNYGCDSIITIYLTVNDNTYSTITETSCNSYTSPSGNYTWSSSGSYFDTIPNLNGCDSLITVNLSIVPVDTSVSQFGSTLFANEAGAVYQWVDCNNSYSVISGETNQSFSPIVSGNYAVIINKNNCSEISNCYIVIISDISNIKSEIKIYPNPTAGIITVKGLDILNFEVLNTSGQTIIKSNPDRNNFVIDLKGYSQGIYFIKIITKSKVYLEKVVLK